MPGKKMIEMGREAFLSRSPPFMGDILWEHLEILQQGIEIVLAACRCICLFRVLFLFVCVCMFAVAKLITVTPLYVCMYVRVWLCLVCPLATDLLDSCV